ncbi:MAG: hypothetical protein K1X64_11245 [Myxococcaceae bacterium]|nr:hypothetical protein [Myxococcaceae bacterium]
MKSLIQVAVVAVVFASGAAFANKPCKWTDADKIKTHLESSITYPTTGKAVKEAYKTEELTKEERACFDGKIKDGAKFKTAHDVEVALGVAPKAEK